MIEELGTDYLIIGAGAQGMAFADELVSQSKSLRIMLVDRRATPGGHWNNAYRFVTLHQPAAFYGVNSERLEEIPKSINLIRGSSGRSPVPREQAITSTASAPISSSFVAMLAPPTRMPSATIHRTPATTRETSDL